MHKHGEKTARRNCAYPPRPASPRAVIVARPWSDAIASSHGGIFASSHNVSATRAVRLARRSAEYIASCEAKPIGFRGARSTSQVARSCNPTNQLWRVRRPKSQTCGHGWGQGRARRQVWPNSLARLLRTADRCTRGSRSWVHGATCGQLFGNNRPAWNSSGSPLG